MLNHAGIDCLTDLPNGLWLSTFMSWKSWPGWAVRVRLASSPMVWVKSRQCIMFCFRGAQPEPQAFYSGQMSEGCRQSHPLLWLLCISLFRMITLAPFSANSSKESNGASVLVLESGSEESYQPSCLTELWFAAAQSCGALDLVSFCMKSNWKMCT